MSPGAVEDAGVALVHDYLLVLRGAERTFASMTDIWPGARVFTALYDADGTHRRFASHTVVTSFLQRTGATQSNFRKLLPLFPLALERLPVGHYPVVISSSSAFAHGVRPRPDAVHVCYCHTPFRYAWFERDRALAEAPRPLRPVLAAVLAAIRRWDCAVPGRVTQYVANSEGTRRRIRELYGREATVVHPPVDVERFEAGEAEDYFLTVTEVVPHKRVEVAAAAAADAGVRLKVVGTGPDLERLRAKYGQNVEFVGRVDDSVLERLYACARAVVVPNVEEFGIAAVEGQAAGRPVLAAGAGGVLETVVEGETGRFVEPGNVRELARALREFRSDDYDVSAIRANAQRFSAAAFRGRIREEVERAVSARG